METLLLLLKIDLGISHDLRDAFLVPLIEAVIKEIERRGITLNEQSSDDNMLIVDYAAWVYRNRLNDVPLAQNIQHRLRNRIIKERMNRQDAIL